MTDPERLRILLTNHERQRLAPYRDSKNIWSIGIGRNLEGNGFSRAEVISLLAGAKHDGRRITIKGDNLTISLSRNLADGISKDEALYLFENDIAVVNHELTRLLPVFSRLSPVRQAVLISMGFMGVGKVLGFKNMIAALERADWKAAEAHLLDSKYARDVGRRAVELGVMLRTNRWPADMKV